MDKIGISFRSTMTPDEVRDTYIHPLREALQQAAAGIYSNYLRQVDPDEIAPTEHLLIFEVRDFKIGLHTLRVAMQNLQLPEGIQFQNLNPSPPPY